MLMAVDFLVFLKDAVADAGAHEVVVTLTGAETAAHCRPRQATPLTALVRKGLERGTEEV